MKTTTTLRKNLQHTCGLLVLAALLPMMMLIGCSEEPEPVVIQKKATPPPPTPVAPAPTVTPIADLMVRYNIDDRVVLPEDRAPDNDPDRIAVLQFFDAFVRGDAATIGTMIGYADQAELQELVDSGRWDAATGDAVARVELHTGFSPNDDDTVLALYEDDAFNFQGQMWYFHGADDGYTFEAVSSPPDIVNRLYGQDLIAAWHDILAQELALANEPDEVVAMKQVDLDQSESRSGLSSGGLPGRQSEPAADPFIPGKGTKPEPMGR